MSERARLPAVEGSGPTHLFDGEPRTVRLSLPAGDSVPPHRHPERDVVFHLLEGAIDLQLGDETTSLEPGDVVRFDGAQDVSPTAREDSVALLVLARKP